MRPYGGSLLTPIHFCVPDLIFGRLVAKYLAENGVSGTFFKEPGIYPYGVSLLTPIDFHVPSLICRPLMAKYWAEDGVSGTFWKKTIDSIHFIPGIYPYWVRLLTSIHTRVPRLIFGPLVAKYWAKNGVSGTFWKNYWLNWFHTWHLPLWGEFIDPYRFSCY